MAEEPGEKKLLAVRQALISVQEHLAKGWAGADRSHLSENVLAAVDQDLVALLTLMTLAP